jgi:hypothetical protein
MRTAPAKPGPNEREHAQALSTVAHGSCNDFASRCGWLQQQLEDRNDRFLDAGDCRVFDCQLLVLRHCTVIRPCYCAVVGSRLFGICAAGFCACVRRRNRPNRQHDGDCVMGQPGT